jgi:hypothetical protein
VQSLLSEINSGEWYFESSYCKPNPSLCKEWLYLSPCFETLRWTHISLRTYLRRNYWREMITLLLRNLLLFTSKKVSLVCLTNSIFPAGFPANVAYQELNVPLSCILPEHRCFLPNIWYSSSSQHDHLRLVALVSTTNIEEGSELFSTYYTLVVWSCFMGPFWLSKLIEAVRYISQGFSWCSLAGAERLVLCLHVIDIWVKRWHSQEKYLIISAFCFVLLACLCLLCYSVLRNDRVALA